MEAGVSGLQRCAQACSVPRLGYAGQEIAYRFEPEG